jgi:tol-pal system protein YbgF
MRKLIWVLLSVCVINTVAVADLSNHTDTSGLTDDQRIARLENQQQYYATLTTQLSKAQSRIDALQGEIEDLQHQLSQVQQNQAAITTLQQQVAQLKAQQVTQAASPVKSKNPQEQKDMKAGQLFQAAYRHLMAKHYNSAQRDFTQYVKLYPKGEQIGEAYYWLGQLYLVQGNPDKATQAFRSAMDYPTSEKAPDAMLQLGVIYQTNGDSAHAKQLFQKVVANYPGTPAAKNAQQHLKSLSPASSG